MYLALKTRSYAVQILLVCSAECTSSVDADYLCSQGTRHAEFMAIAQIMQEHPTSILKSTDLYVTVEPCVMCASMLRQFGIRAVYFGCYNERFGGTGGVLNIHNDPSIDPPYPVYGGIFREEAIMLLRRFYVQENEKAPEPARKKDRVLKTEIEPLNVDKNPAPS